MYIYIYICLYMCISIYIYIYICICMYILIALMFRSALVALGDRLDHGYCCRFNERLTGVIIPGEFCDSRGSLLISVWRNSART